MKALLVLTATCLFTLNVFSQENDSTKAPAVPTPPAAPEAPAMPSVTQSNENADTTSHKVLGDTPEVKKAGDTTRIRLGKKGITIVEKNGKSSVTIDNIDSEDLKDIDNEKAEADDKDDDNVGEMFNDMNKDKKHHKKHFEPHFAGVEIFLNNFMTADHSMTLPPDKSFMELNTSRSIGVRVNIIEYGIPVTDEMGFTTGLGFEFNSYYFSNDNNIKKDKGFIVTKPKEDGASDYTKNKLKDTYLNIPLLYEIQFPLGKPSKPLYLAAGVIGGIKIGSSTKEYYTIKGHDQRIKIKDDFYLSPFRYALQAKVGFRHLHLVATYYPTSLFQVGKGPELYPFDLGLVLVNF